MLITANTRRRASIAQHRRASRLISAVDGGLALRFALAFASVSNRAGERASLKGVARPKRCAVRGVERTECRDRMTTERRSVSVPVVTAVGVTIA